jgi:hypothetical protein
MSGSKAIPNANEKRKIAMININFSFFIRVLLNILSPVENEI